MSFVPPSIFDERVGQYPQQLNVAQFYLLFDGLRLVRELVALFKTVQRFRGASIAWAGGDVNFQLTSMQLADELARNRYILEYFRTTQNDILPREDWQQLYGDLDFILSNNRDRRYLENFEHKTALLKFVIEMIQRVASDRNYFAVSVENTEREGAKRCFASADDDRKLIKLVFVEILQFTETMGRLRGMATYVSVVADPNPALMDQLKNIDSAIHRELDYFRHCASSFQHYALKGIPSLVVRQVNETQLLQLIGLIKDGLVSQSIEKPDSQQLFRLATEVIDVHLRIVEETLDYLTSKIQHNLQAGRPEQK